MGTLYTSNTTLKSESAERPEERLSSQPEADQEASKSGTGLAKAYGDLGRKAFQTGKLSEAIANYNEALKLDPHSPELHTGLGLVLIQQGKLEEAVAHFSEALKLNPDDKTARESLNLVLAKLGPTKTKTAQPASPTA